jgi:hypothetical protein
LNFMDPFDKISKIEAVQRKLDLQKGQLLDKALSSNDPETILKANSNVPTGLPTYQNSDRKSFVVDPFDFQASFGYKHRPTSMSYEMLDNMAKTPIINAILRTRINQVAAFAEPVRDKYSIGFKIRKKARVGVEQDKLTLAEEKEIEKITDFLLAGGSDNDWTGDNFDTFTRKVFRDSLRRDQMTFEVIWNNKGEPHEFYAVDSKTIRVADTFNIEDYQNNPYGDGANRKKNRGYWPSHVQIYNQEIYAQFYPWELSWGVRNPASDIHLNGYGVSELEEMVSVITSMLWSDEYNRRFFKQGSAPKGMFRVQGNINPAKLHEFRQNWNATMRGVWNSWRTPILEADKVEWIDLHKSNRDMEYHQWVEYLIKLGCAIYAIDPAEVNFPLQGGASQNSLFEGSNEQRLKHSKDKGLYPLLKFYQAQLNKQLIKHFYEGKYELQFVGLDAMTPQEEQEMDIKAVANYETVNEVRKRRGLPEIDGGDVILNAQFMQKLSMDQQAELFGEGGMPGEEGEGEQPGAGEETEKGDQSNPFEDALQNYFKSLEV